MNENDVYSLPLFIEKLNAKELTISDYEIVIEKINEIINYINTPSMIPPFFRYGDKMNFEY